MENTPEVNEKKYTLEEIIEIIKALKELEAPRVIYVYPPPYTQPTVWPTWKPYIYTQPYTTNSSEGVTYANGTCLCQPS